MTEQFRKRIAVPALAWSIALILGSTSALGQAKPKTGQDPASVKSGDGDGGVLAGPKVEQEAQADKVPPMRQQERGRGQQDDIPFQQWMTALRGLDLSEEQQAKVRAISQEFQKAQREYQDSHGEDAKEMMRQAREAREAGTPPPKDIREKLQKIEGNRPKPAAYQTRIWSELTEPQRDKMKNRLDEMRKEMDQRRAKRQAEGKGNGQADGKDGDDTMTKSPEGRRRRLAQPPNGEKPAMAPEDPMNEAPQERPAAAGEKPRDGQPNERFQRRMKFLRSHQSGKHPDGQPTAGEKQFKFNEQDEKEPPSI